MWSLCPFWILKESGSVATEYTRAPAARASRGESSGLAPFEATALHVWKMLRIRTAERVAKSNQLDRYAHDHLREDRLSSVGELADLGATIGGGQPLWALRTRPSELLLLSLSTDRTPIPRELSDIFDGCAAAADRWPLLAVVDDSDGVTALRLAGTEARSVLLRLADATSLPHAPGQATQLRMADLRALLACHDDGYTALLASPYRSACIDWLRYAVEGMGLDAQRAVPGL